ncbi:MAG: hypothetical protein CL586_00875 [Alteromonadaceae bacterium]|jgi:hypothetical protein|nr:hypothetical protein [Alteromonadaceae bacterium]|tara:strand:+ start:248 stop:715 length:468 start_codon:yes stop_codon:yes gene_type:complete
MAFALTDYQIAALQAMQIPVWQPQDKLAKPAGEVPDVAEKVKSEPVSQDTARSHLQRIKDSVAAKPAPSQTTKTDEPVAPQEAPPVLQVISAQQAPQFFADLLIAVQGLAMETVPPVKVGAPVSVSQTAITLPVAPDALTKQHKMQLWQALCALS